MTSQPDEISVLKDRLNRSPAGDHWNRLGLEYRSGINVPLASLRSGSSMGVGDIHDLELLIDWCAALRARVIQLLPLADMGTGSCPYSAVSAFAMDPIYISLDSIPGFKSDENLQRAAGEASARLNALERIDYGQVRETKLALLRQAWDLMEKPVAGMDGFLEDNPWVEPYLEFKLLKARNSNRCWEEWPEEDRRWEPGRRDRDREEKAFHLWLQFLLDRQLRAAKKRAEARGVKILGDIPILVARDSADVWADPVIFQLNTSAGAPPDMYAQDGQNWGTPTYDWAALQARNYDWWRARLAQAQRYYDLYRIDHVVGFFRIWTIAQGETSGRNGWFVPAEEHRWGEQGRAILAMMLESTTMLPVAEDLGTIPPVCRSTLEEFGICGMKVQRWEKRWHGDRRFIEPTEYPALSVATLSTHDSETLGQWWELFPQERQELWELMGQDEVPPEHMDTETFKLVLAWFSQAGSLFTIYLLQELLAALGVLPGAPETHRINIPGTVQDFNWSWKMPILLEELLSDEDGTDLLADLIEV